MPLQWRGRGAPTTVLFGGARSGMRLRWVPLTPGVSVPGIPTLTVAETAAGLPGKPTLTVQEGAALQTESGTSLLTEASAELQIS